MLNPAVIFFDVNETLLDTRPLHEAVDIALGKDGISKVWFTTLLQYSLVVTSSQHYFYFGDIGAACLKMVGASLGTPIDDVKAKSIMEIMKSLPGHRDVEPGLERLKAKGFRLVALTNSPTPVVSTQLKQAGLERYFELMIGVDEVKVFKPHSLVYQWAARRMGVKPVDCMLVASHGWDIAGAAWSGMQTAFLKRPGKELFPLADAPDLSISSLIELAERLTQEDNSGVTLPTTNDAPFMHGQV